MNAIRYKTLERETFKLLIKVDKNSDLNILSHCDI